MNNNPNHIEIGVKAIRELSPAVTGQHQTNNKNKASKNEQKKMRQENPTKEEKKKEEAAKK